MADVGARTLELLLRAGVLTDAELTAPSRLPGWTRGHVLAHLADNARAFAVVARRAAEAPADDMDAGGMYASREARDRSIEEGAGRSRARHLADLVGSAHAF